MVYCSLYRSLVRPYISSFSVECKQITTKSAGFPQISRRLLKKQGVKLTAVPRGGAFCAVLSVGVFRFKFLAKLLVQFGDFRAKASVFLDYFLQFLLILSKGLLSEIFTVLATGLVTILIATSQGGYEHLFG